MSDTVDRLRTDCGFGNMEAIATLTRLVFLEAWRQNPDGHRLREKNWKQIK